MAVKPGAVVFLVCGTCGASYAVLAKVARKVSYPVCMVCRGTVSAYRGTHHAYAGDQLKKAGG